jgi:hypothetical protein
VIERYQLLGIFDRQHFEQHRVKHAENRRVRPDAEREREHSHGGEAGILEELAEGEAKVVHSSLNRDSLNR